MSLRVWLPLNGNLNNQGLSDVAVTNNGATIDNNGKIGKCYSFSASSAKITNTLSSSVTSAVGTMSCWVKFNSFPASRAWYCLMQLGTTGGFANCRLGLYMQYQTDIVVCINGSGDNNLYKHSLTTNQWYHLCTTFDGTTVRLYIDGVEVWNKTAVVGSYTTAASTLFVGGTNNYYFKGYMNDVRYYSTALSPKEIEILSRGLVCHYPLNGGGRGGDNLLKNTGDLTLWTKESGITTTWDSEKNMYKIEDSTHTNSRWGIYQDINVEPNSTYTITVTLDGTACGAGFAVYDSSTSFPPAVIGTTGRQSYTLTSGVNSTKARVYLYTNCGVSKVAWFSLPKVEKSNHTTPWIPNSADSAYTAMGYDSTAEYDVSGYGYNGTKQYITYETDTPRYSVSSVLSGSSTRIPNTTINIGNEWSYGLWFKSAAAARSWEGLVILNNSGGDTDIQLGFYTNPNSSQIQTTANGQYNMISHTYDDKWHHLFATFDGTTLKTYKDGELVNTKTITNSLLSRSNLTIGARRRGEVTFDCPYKGSISDFRLYATALSAAQVAELYNTAVSVANNGTLMDYELVEV